MKETYLSKTSLVVYALIGAFDLAIGLTQPYGWASFTCLLFGVVILASVFLCLKEF